jgi:hypothetical protein
MCGLDNISFILCGLPDEKQELFLVEVFSFISWHQYIIHEQREYWNLGNYLSDYSISN